MLMFKKKLVLLLSCYSFWQPVYALKILPISDQQTSVIEISQKEFTRLNIKDDRIKQIFGGTQDLTIEVDEEGGQIFIKPFEARNRPIRMTMITETGLTHDLKLIPKLQESESILFMAGQSPADSPNPLTQPERNEEILTMIKKLARNINKKGSHTPSASSPEKRQYPGLSVKLIDQFSENQTTGYTYEITNIGDSLLTLAEENLYLPGDMAVCLLKTQLEPGKSTELFVIRKETDEDNTPLR